jgi:hypothetical protein
MLRNKEGINIVTRKGYKIHTMKKARAPPRNINKLLLIMCA